MRAPLIFDEDDENNEFEEEQSATAAVPKYYILTELMAGNVYQVLQKANVEGRAISWDIATQIMLDMMIDGGENAPAHTDRGAPVRFQAKIDSK